jgi:hypothetical protein
MSAHPWIWVVVSLVAGGLLFALVAYVVVRWLAFRIASRVAESVERRLAGSLQRQLDRSGVLRRPLDPALEARYLRDIDRLAWLMDRLVPMPIVGGVGLDALLGLIPGVGDAIGFGVSALIVIRAAQLGLAPDIISRLLAIQLIDAALGAIPVAGDVFDAVYKADLRSAAIVRQALAARARPEGRNRDLRAGRSSSRLL